MESLLLCTMSMGVISNPISMLVTASLRPAIMPPSLLAGAMPRRQQNLILAWAELHQDELLQNWRLVEQEQILNKIDGLK